MRLRILRRHIKNGEHNSYKNCPIALALKERMNTNNVCVACGTWNVDYKLDGKHYFGSLQKDAQNFIKNYECNYTYVKPTTITIDF